MCFSLFVSSTVINPSRANENNPKIPSLIPGGDTNPFVAASRKSRLKNKLKQICQIKYAELPAVVTRCE